MLVFLGQTVDRTSCRKLFGEDDEAVDTEELNKAEADGENCE